MPEQTANATQPTENQQTAQPQQATQPQTATPAPEDIPEEKLKIYAERYKNDFNEAVKAKYHQDKELTRLQQENAALRKATKPEAKAEAPKETTSQTEAKAEAKEKETSAVEKASAAELANQLYVDIADGGKPSDETISMLKEAGYTDEQIKEEVLAKQTIMQSRMKAAQQYADTDIKELLNWTRTEGNLSDHQLAILQGALNIASEPGNEHWYKIVSVIDNLYKSSQKTTVNHGSIPANAQTDGYSSPQEYYKDRDSGRYNIDKDFRAEVDAKYRRSNTDNWSKQLLNSFVGRR